MAGLIIKNLSKIYEIESKKIHALNNINLTIPDGSFVTIVGKSGCGKTTLLKLLCGLEDKTCGTIDYTHTNNSDNNRISIVFQEPRLMPWLTVEENMAFSLINCKDKNNVSQKVSTYLKLLGLYNFRKAYPSQISGGMAQRTSLGRTLCYEPQIILMDEPLGALDAFNRKKLQNELINIFLKCGKTIIFVTHDIEEAICLGQKIVVMDRGSIIKEIPVSMDYYRDTSSLEFFHHKNQVLNILNKFLEEEQHEFL
ncbi:ATP-binding cassette domain-containing protein [Clostridium bowmanii]|uniref:ABC transporter ATP-binding protein n=1 Tax=Clostridium bowmanii TaxID=132925 RepID=UPI001C0CCFC0|nr:ATP-binding cassette domain-containing protein [Clostridium bowmanii]MBU3188158.1 ATP-binding cassette domain-containing protein [Clostridium bowmanii]MCA1072340.1 ATP-binding cassette domain-containing protein [Clostridium bowmanii]